MTDDLTTFAASANGFGFRLLAELAAAQPGATVLISPFSIATALAMTFNGAAGATAAEMAATLGWAGQDLAALNAGAQALLAELLAADPAVTLKIANSLWPDRAFALAPAFAARTAAAYAAAVEVIDYRDPVAAAGRINDWVAAQTAQMIRQVLAPADVANAVMALVNALYFKGAWRHPFDPHFTQEQPFHSADGSTVAAPFMRQQRAWRYAEVDAAQVLWLPFGGGRMGMVLALPPAQQSLADFQRQVDAALWARWLAAGQEMPGVVTLPRLSLRARAGLESVLPKMGMAIAFTGAADFHLMGDGPLMISQVVHEVRFEVNEEGAEAAAATAVVMGRSAPLHRFTALFDRPFFAAIYDPVTAAVLFAGYVATPAGG